MGYWDHPNNIFIRIKTTSEFSRESVTYVIHSKVPSIDETLLDAYVCPPMTKPYWTPMYVEEWDSGERDVQYSHQWLKFN